MPAIELRRMSAGVLGLLLAGVVAVLMLVHGSASEHSVIARGVHPRATHPAAGAHHGLSSLPLAAQGPVSAVLGGEDGAYRITGLGRRYEARNPAQSLRMRFDRAGVRVLSSGAQIGLRLGALGSGTSLRAVSPATPRAKGDRVVYTHGNLSEWYINGPLGLEQGFTLARAPVGHAGMPLVLSLVLSGNAHPSLDPHGRSLTLTVPGGASLRYGNLLATDARGRALRSWITLQPGRVLLHVDTHGARYPLSVDPLVQQGDTLVQQGAKLTGKEETGEGSFGFSVALSSDGNTALIGGPGDNKFVGAAWVFTRSEGKWTQVGGKLTGKEETGAGEFGTSVALSSGATVALIGGPTDNKNVGAAWVFTESEGKWTQQGAKITGKEETGEGEFGYGVALSSGTTALVGGPSDNKKVGAAWVFTESEGKWTQQGAKITGKEETGEGEFGWKVALSSEGDTALIGGFGDNKDAGAAWVFTRSEGKWTQQGGKLTGKEEKGEGWFGYSVALSSNGNTALIGGPGDNTLVGAVWVFTRAEGKWTQQGGKLTGKEEVGGGYFGYGVALSSDGNMALIGGPYDDSSTGAAWVFTRSAGNWTQRGGKLTGKEETGSGKVGFRVALSSEGTTALIGGYEDNKGAGATWVFANSTKLTGKEETGMGEFGYSVALSSEGSTALIGGPADNNVGAAWVFTRSEGKWTQQGGKLTGKEEVGGGYFGGSVALSADGNTALIGGAFDSSSTGAAWVFTRSEGKWTQQGAKLTGKEEDEAPEFGTSVALSADGNTALIGGPRDSPGAEDVPGAAWVFTRSEGKWTQQGAKLTGKEGSGFLQAFGYSVALSSDGNTALIGGPWDNKYAGAAWVFTRTEGKWTQQGGKLTGKAEEGEGWFGYSVALASEGSTALIAGPYDDKYLGAAWAFTRSEGKWTQQGGKLTADEGGTDSFGESVALASNGNIALIGGSFDLVLPSTNSAWTFTRTEGKWTQQGSHLTGIEGLGTPALASVALSSEGSTALLGGPEDNRFVGAVWAFISAPMATTGAATGVTEREATLHGTVNPEGKETKYYFEFGTTESYGSKSAEASVGSGTGSVEVSKTLTGLAANTQYHYRIVATSGNGTTDGTDKVFTTT
jgi:hypothetical protein